MNTESRFTFSAGMAIRKTVVSQIKNAAFKAGVNITVDEDKHFFESNYRVVLSGEDKAVFKLKMEIEDYFERLERDEVP